MSSPERNDRDAGFTLPELVVTMSVVGVVLAILGTLFANVAQYTNAAASSRDATGQAALAMDEVGQVVRTAADMPTSPTTSMSAIWSDDAHPSGAFSLWVTAYSRTVATAPQPSLVHLFFDSTPGDRMQGCLVEDRHAVVDPTSPYPTFAVTGSPQCIAGSRDDPFILSGDPFFSYLTSAGAVIPIGTGHLTATQASTVTFIVVTPVVRKAHGLPGNDQLVLSSAIGMPNLARDVSSSVVVPTVPTDTPSPPASP